MIVNNVDIKDEEDIVKILDKLARRAPMTRLITSVDFILSILISTITWHASSNIHEIFVSNNCATKTYSDTNLIFTTS